MTDLTVDPARKHHNKTNIFVRARKGQEFVSVDIAELDRASLLAWLRSRGGENVWAENVIGILLDHGHLTELDHASG